MVKSTKTAVKAPTATKTVEKKTPAKKAEVKKPVVAAKPAAKPATKKVAPAKKPVAKKVVAKPATKSVAVAAAKKKAPAKKPVARKVVAKKAPAKKAAPKKAVVKKTVAPKAAPLVKPVVEKTTPIVKPAVQKAFKKERNIFVCYGNAFKKYFDFKGRTSRWGYWSFVLINFIISFALGALAVCCVPYIDTAYSLLVFIPGMALSFRRLHDVNRSGWWFGLPVFCIFVLAALASFGALTSYINPEYMYPDNVSSMQIAASLAYSIVGIVSFALLLYVFVLSFFKGTKGKNKYGDEPNV